MDNRTPGYYRKRVYAGRVMFFSEYFSGRMGRRGRGSPPKKKSSYEITMAHWRRQKRELAILVNANFKAGTDQSLTLEWGKDREKPETKEEMQKQMTNFIKRLRRRYARGDPGRELKYIYTMEIGPRGSRHIHMILNDVDLQEVQKCWGLGPVHGTPLYEDGNYTELAEYYMKYTKPKKPETEEEKEGEKLGKRWYASQNLYRPEPVTRKITERTFQEDLPEVEGYHVDPDSIIGGVETDQNGRPFREAVYIMDKTTKERRRPLKRGKKARAPGRRKT